MKRKIKENFSKVDEERLMTTTKKGDALCLSCTRPSRPLHKKLTNYVLEKNFTKIDDDTYVTTERERENVYAITTRPRNTPLYKKQDNYVCKAVLTPDRENKRQNGRRMKEDGEEMFTLTAQDKHGIYDGYRIRRLTPKECERLQGFPDNWTKYGKDNEPISDTQRYKCCGNAVTTNVITAIINEMFKEVIEDETD